MKKILMTAMVCLAAMPTTAMAKGKTGCFTPADIEAEQAIRIRSELMVIGLNCQASRYRGTSENLYAAYRQFTADHGPELAAYEKQMLDYYRRSGVKNPEASLNTLGTEFGNKISLDVAKMRPDMFCYQYSPRMQKTKGMSAEQFRQWAHTSYASHPPTHPPCQ